MTEPQATQASTMDYLKALPQYLVPGHLVSRAVHKLTRVQWPVVKNPMIDVFMKHFDISLDEAVNKNPHSFDCFNAFFTRALEEQARPVEQEQGLITSPVDGTISQLGDIDDECIFQAKGHSYSLVQLLGGSQERAETYRGGKFATIYLSPRDYHRIHMPMDGELREMVHIPGRLFSVNGATTRVIPGLFARNERVASLFQGQDTPFAMVKVGAINVGSIETVWAGEITPPAGHMIHRWLYQTKEERIKLQKGQEMGRFNMGSTVILLFPSNTMQWSEELSDDSRVRMGQAIAYLS